MRQKAYKYRIYPTKEQEKLISKSFGSVRFVYNRALDIKTSLYQKEKKGISIFELTNQMTTWKESKEFSWLKEVNSQSLQMSLRNLDSAFTRFFTEKNGFPKFKSKYDKQSFQNPQATRVDPEAGRVFIPKFRSGIKCVFHRKFEGKIKTSTVSKNAAGKYFISILVEERIDNPAKPEKDETKTLGIDLGLKNFLVSSDGNKVENPRHLKKRLRKLARSQRKLSRRKKGSKNRDKQKRVVARIHEKVANTRKDFLHKLTSRLVKNQDYTGIAIEDLSVKNMIKNRRLAGSIADAGWGMFREFLTYKCEWYGKNLTVIGRFEPSSKLCTCGHKNDKLTLKDRIWTCVKCGTVHDRDMLAAQNIKRFAFCEQNTHKTLIPQELREFTLGENGVSCSGNQEAIINRKISLTL
jgi:putative transposase